MLNLNQFRLSSSRRLNLFKQTRARLSNMNSPLNRSSSTTPSRPNLDFYTSSGQGFSPVRNSSTAKRPRPSSSSSSSPYPGRFSSPYLSRLYSNYSSGGGYSAPRSSTLSPDTAFWILFGLNAASFGTFWYARLTENRRLLQLHLDHTRVSLSSWDSGRWWTVLTSAFTHQEVTHFAVNMITLRTFCQIIGFVPGIGGGHVLALALASALCGSGGWLLQQKARLDAVGGWTKGWGKSSFNSAAAGQVYYSSALGASGAVMGVGAVATCLLPTMRISLMFIPVGIPLWIVTIGYAAMDTYFLNSQTSRTAHAGHLGGLVCGAAYYLAFLRHAPVGILATFTRRFGRR